MVPAFVLRRRSTVDKKTSLGEKNKRKKKKKASTIIETRRLAQFLLNIPITNDSRIQPIITFVTYVSGRSSQKPILIFNNILSYVSVSIRNQ